MKMFTRTNKTDLPVSWATACDLRRLLDSASFTQWNLDTLTSKDRKALGRLQYHLDMALEETRSLQASLSKRSAEAGHDRPDFEASRLLNG